MDPSERPGLILPAAGQKRQVRFVASDEDGLPVKRRQVQQACEACRKKKKKCSHGYKDAEGSAPDSHRESPQKPEPGGQPGPRTKLLKTAGPPAPCKGTSLCIEASVASQLLELSTSRFVGDLLPESVFIHAGDGQHPRQPSLHRNHSEIGTWMRHLPPSSSSDGLTASSDAPGVAKRHAQVLLPLGGRLQKPYDRNIDVGEGLAVCPPAPYYQHLHQIYSERIHPVLPILNDSDVRATKVSHAPSIRYSVFRQAISLAAGLDPSARSHLHLEDGGPLVSPSEFHHHLAKAIFISLDADVLTDRVDRIRILLFMFLFYQPRHVSDRDMLPLIFSQAVHYSQTLGIHLRGYGKGSDDTHAETLFCLLWALDRINAGFHGRACLLHERDTDRDVEACIERQERPAFKLFLKVAEILQKVISLYRPRYEGVDSVELPVFETVILDAGAEKVPSSLLASIEVFYHAVSILSCRRHPHPKASPPETSSAAIPPPSINARRSLSADRIVDSVVSSLSHQPPSPSSDGIYILPFVPYAVALSLSVMYLKMRYSKIPMYRSRAKTRFREIVGLLHLLGEVYTTANFNAGLGIAILNEMDRTAKGLANPNGTVVTGITTAGAGAITPRQAARVEAQSRPAAPPGETAVTEEDMSPGAESLVGGQPSEGPPSATFTLSEANAQTSSELTPTTVDEAAAGPGPQQAEKAECGLSMPPWGDTSDVDLFVHFDPGFDLGAVDAALEANLEMGYPQAWSMQWPE